MYSVLKSTFSTQVKQKLARILSFPSKLVIEPVSFCNLRCPICPAGTNSLPRKKTAMPLQQFKNIIDQIKGRVDFLRLHGYGEPFLHNDIVEMIAYAKASGIKTVLVSTNGTQFGDVAFAKKLVASGLDRIVFSADGINQKTHEVYRVGGQFNKLTAGIRALAQAKKELNASVPLIFFQFLILKHNEQLRSKAISLATSLGANYFTEKSLIITHDDKKEFQTLCDTFLPLDPSFNFYKLTPRGYQYYTKFMDDCSQIYSTMYINADGSVYPCCQDTVRPTSPRHPYYVGDAFKEPLKKIWSGKKLKQFRQRVFSNQRKVQACRRCPTARVLPAYEGNNYEGYVLLNP